MPRYDINGIEVLVGTVSFKGESPCRGLMLRREAVGYTEHLLMRRVGDRYEYDDFISSPEPPTGTELDTLSRDAPDVLETLVRLLPRDGEDRRLCDAMRHAVDHHNDLRGR